MNKNYKLSPQLIHTYIHLHHINILQIKEQGRKEGGGGAVATSPGGIGEETRAADVGGDGDEDGLGVGEG